MFSIQSVLDLKFEGWMMGWTDPVRSIERVTKYPVFGIRYAVDRR